MFDRHKTKLDPRAYRQVLLGEKLPIEWQGLHVVDLHQRPQGFKSIQSSPDHLVDYSILALLEARRRELTSSTQGLAEIDGKFYPAAYFLAVGMPGSEETGGYGATIRAIKTIDDSVVGFFGSALQLLPVDERGEQSDYDHDYDPHTRVLAGFRLVISPNSQELAPEIFDLWEQLLGLWRIAGG